MLSAIEGRADEPGLAVSVIRGGEVAATRCVGLAHERRPLPIGGDTRFHVVSVSKTFMAAGVLVLAAKGALALDDDVRRYLPGRGVRSCFPTFVVACVSFEHLPRLLLYTLGIGSMDKCRFSRPDPVRSRGSCVGR